MPQPKQILFLGTHGQFNIGDELLLETFLWQLGREHSYAVNSYDPAYTARQLGGQFQVDVFRTDGDRLHFLNHIRRADLVFFGGGSIVKELYASVGRNRYATLMMILLTVTFARQLARKPVVMSNIGVGPLQTPNGFRLARLILRQVDRLAVRDRNSYEICAKLGLSPSKLRQVPDAVFVQSPATMLGGEGMVPPPPQALDGSRPLQVALNLNYNIENPANWEPFLSALAEGLTAFHARTPIEIHALPMQSKFKANDDLQILTAFQARIPGIPLQLHSPESHHDVANLIAACDLVVAARLHTLVTAAILGRPFLSLMYDVKVRELTAALEMLDHAIDINRPFAPALLVEKLDKLTAARTAVGAGLFRRAAELRQELETYFQSVRDMIAKLD